MTELQLQAVPFGEATYDGEAQAQAGAGLTFDARLLPGAVNLQQGQGWLLAGVAKAQFIGAGADVDPAALTMGQGVAEQIAQ